MVREGTSYDPSLCCAAQPLYLEGSVDIKSRVLVFTEFSMRCVKIFQVQRTVPPLEVGGMWVFLVNLFIILYVLVYMPNQLIPPEVLKMLDHRSAVCVLCHTVEPREM